MGLRLCGISNEDISLCDLCEALCLCGEVNLKRHSPQRHGGTQRTTETGFPTVRLSRCALNADRMSALPAATAF